MSEPTTTPQGDVSLPAPEQGNDAVDPATTPDKPQSVADLSLEQIISASPAVGEMAKKLVNLDIILADNAKYRDERRKHKSEAEAKLKEAGDYQKLYESAEASKAELTEASATLSSELESAKAELQIAAAHREYVEKEVKLLMETIKETNPDFEKELEDVPGWSKDASPLDKLKVLNWLRKQSGNEGLRKPPVPGAPTQQPSGYQASEGAYPLEKSFAARYGR